MPSSYLLQAASSGIGRDRRLQRSCLLGLVRFCCWRSRETSVFCPTPPTTRVLSPQFSTAHGRFDRLRVRTKCALGCTRACECSWPQVGYRLPTGHRAHPSRRPTQAGGGFLKEKRNGKSSLTLDALWARFPTPRCTNCHRLPTMSILCRFRRHVAHLVSHPKYEGPQSAALPKERVACVSGYFNGGGALYSSR